MHESIEELIDSLSDMYDKDALEFDMSNNNYTLNTTVQDYYKPQIVANSVINGQFKQAKEQIRQYDLTSDDLSELISADHLARILTV